MTNNPQENVSLRTKVLTGAYWLAGLTFVGQAITWASTLVVIRLLTPEDYGLVAMASILIGFFQLLNEAGLGAAVIQKASISETELRKVFGCVVLLNVVFTILSIICAPAVALFFSEPRVELILQISSVNFILQSFFFLPQSLLRRNIEFRYKSTIDLIGNLVSCGIVLSMALMGFGVWALVCGPIGMNFFKAFAFNLRRDIRFLPLFSFRGIRDLLSFGAHVMINQILWYFYSQSDITIAGKVLGKNDMGIYSVAIQLVSIPVEKLSPIFVQVGFPAFSKIQDNLEAIQSIFLRIVRVLNLISFPTFVGMALVAPYAIPLILGTTWQDTVIPFQLVCFTMPLRFIDGFFGPIMVGYGRPDIMTGNMLYAIVIMPVAFYLGSFYGIIGLCSAWLIAYPVLFLIMLFRVFRVLELRMISIFMQSRLALGATMIMSLTLSVFRIYFEQRLSSFTMLAIMIPLGAIVYAGTVWTLDRNLWPELKSFFSSS